MRSKTTLTIFFTALALFGSVIAIAQGQPKPWGLFKKDAEFVAALHLDSRAQTNYDRLLGQTLTSVDEAFHQPKADSKLPGQDLNHLLYGRVLNYRTEVHKILNPDQTKTYDSYWKKWAKKHGLGNVAIGQPAVLAAGLEPDSKTLKKLRSLDDDHKAAKKIEKLLTDKETKLFRAELKGKADTPKVRAALLRAAWLTAY